MSSLDRQVDVDKDVVNSLFKCAGAFQTEIFVDLLEGWLPFLRIGGTELVVRVPVTAEIEENEAGLDTVFGKEVEGGHAICVLVVALQPLLGLRAILCLVVSRSQMVHYRRRIRHFGRGPGEFLGLDHVGHVPRIFAQSNGIVGLNACHRQHRQEFAGALLKAATVDGAIHGLATFAQLILPGTEGYGVSAVRTLVCYECGAVGPGKDCGYENPILKAITGFPMAMEGKTAACAHFSPLGNIAAATCDTWSNESVQNVKLLAGMAPTCYVEQLIYDCRLMNEALADGRDAALLYRKWMVSSDASRDPQAYVLTPDSAVAIAQAIISAPSAYDAGKAAALTALRLMRDAHRDGALKIHPREVPWLDRLQKTVEALPAKEPEFIDQMMAEVDTTKFVAADYGIG